MAKESIIKKYARSIGRGAEYFEKYNDGQVYNMETFTCYDCQIASDCENAFDLYNINGECIAEK